MEINNIEYIRILKKILNFMEPKLHKGVFMSVSTSPHSPKGCTNFAYLTSYRKPYIPRPTLMT